MAPSAPKAQIKRARRLSRWRMALYGFALAVGTLVATLIGLELRLRQARNVPGEPDGSSQQSTLEEVVDDATCYTGFVPRSRQQMDHPRGPLHHDLVVDGDGFRVANLDSPRSGACRLLALGDSFTEGLYVEAAQTWPAQLEALLRQRGFSVRVDNGGFRGHTISEERVEALARWSSLRPRVVLVGQTSNDLVDLALQQQAGCHLGGELPTRFVSLLPGRAADLRIVGRALQARARLRGLLARPREDFERGGGGARSVGERCAAAAHEYVSEASELARSLRASGSHLLLFSMEPIVCGDMAYDQRLVFERQLSAQLSSEGARSIDTFAELRAPGRRLTPVDHHPSPSGYAGIAARLADDLVASGWLDACR